MTLQRRRRLIKARRTGVGLVLVLAMSMIAGMADAIGLLMAGDFVSFMSGNTTRAAIDIGHGNWRHAGVLLGAIGCFIVGNAAGVVIASQIRKRLAGLLIMVAFLMCLAAMLPMQMTGSAAFYTVVLAMGMINATVETVEGLPIGLTYVTGALSRFGRGIGRWITGDRRGDWAIQIVPWLGMITGAIIGGLLELWIGQDALWLVAGVTLLVALYAMVIPTRLQARFLVTSKPVPSKRPAKRPLKY